MSNSCRQCSTSLRETCPPAKPCVASTTSILTLWNWWDHVLARCAFNRSKRRVKPGLYALNRPTRDSDVFVTANYRLSFDSLRSALKDRSGYIMVLDTRGINVWCASGKGTFGTDELVERIDTTGLRDVVTHRRLLLPQLGASGVSAHEVKRRSGFTVEYGPVRAKDLPRYLETRTATPEMRKVRFNLAERMTLIPAELRHMFVPVMIAAAIFFVVGGAAAALASAVALLAGAVLFPILLPWLPSPNFSTKGLILGALVAAPFALHMVRGASDAPFISRAGWAAVYVLMMMPVTAYVSLNFTGCTTFTSRTGVRREIFAYIPVMAWLLGLGIALGIVLLFVTR